MHEQELSLTKAVKAVAINDESSASNPDGVEVSSVPRKSVVGRVHEKMGTFR